MSKKSALFASIPPELYRAAGESINRALNAVRSHLGMDVAFVSEFIGSERVFRYVEPPDQPTFLRAGISLPLTEGYCQRVIDGRLPELIPDTSLVPAAMELPITASLPIGAHLSVPIHLSDGQLYGTFCCFSFEPDTSLNDRDLQTMRAFAEVVGHQLDDDLAMVRQYDAKVERIIASSKHGQPEMVYQPIYELQNHRIVGVECLARFTAAPYRSPDTYFNEASEVGMGVELELRAMRSGLEGLKDLPGDFYVTLNSSPQTILSGEIEKLIDGFGAERIVLEITEHAHVPDYPALLEALKPLLKRGVRIAIDDTGAGYASMRHILSLQPNIIKLDRSLTQNIDSDKTRGALTVALIEFARKIDIQIIAEGVETESEQKTLQLLGVEYAQGYYLGHPVSAQALGQLFQKRPADL